MRSRLRRVGLAASVAVLVTTAAACGGQGSGEKKVDSSGGAAGTAYPVTIKNCGRELTFESEPKQVVSLWQAPTEMMLALGKGDRIAGVAGNYESYPKDIAKQAATLKNLGTAMGWPSREVLLSQKPDLVLGQSLEGFAFDTSAGYASPEQIEQAGANVYGVNMCDPADAANMTIDSTAKTLRDLGKIFDASDKAEAIITKLNKQKAAVKDAVVDKKTVKVAYYNGGKGPLNVLAGGIYESAITTAGGTSVFKPGISQVSKEEFAAAQPEVILVGTFDGQDFKTLQTYLKSTFPEMAAVKRGRIVEMPDADTDASVRVMKGLTRIANALHPDLKLPLPTS